MVYLDRAHQYVVFTTIRLNPHTSGRMFLICTPNNYAAILHQRQKAGLINREWGLHSLLVSYTSYRLFKEFAIFGRNA